MSELAGLQQYISCSLDYDPGTAPSKPGAVLKRCQNLKEFLLPRAKDNCRVKDLESNECLHLMYVLLYIIRGCI